MATVTHRIATASTSNASSYATGSFTPTAGDLLVVFAVASGTVAAGTATASANGITFTKVTSALKNASADTIYCFVADQKVPASPAAMTVTVNTTGDAATGCVVFVASVAGMFRTGATAIRQSGKQENQASGTPTVGLVKAALTGNPTLGVVGNGASPAGLTPPTSWTEDAAGDTGYSTPTTGAEYVYRNSGFTGSTITWGSSSATAFGALAIELDTSNTVISPTVGQAAESDSAASGVTTSDTFDALANAASGTSLSVGGNWTQYASAGFEIGVASGQVYNSNATNTAFARSVIIPTAASMFAQVQWAVVEAGVSVQAGPAVLVPPLGGSNAATGSCYVMSVSGTAQTSLSIRKKSASASTLTVLGTSVTVASVVAGDILRLEYQDATAELVGYINGIEKIRRATSLLPLDESGVQRGVGFHVNSAFVNGRLDNFSGGELGVVQSFSHTKSRTLGQPSETETAQVITPTKSNPVYNVAVNQVTETDLAQAFSHTKAKSFGQLTETGQAQPVKATRAIRAGQVAETDLAQPITVRISRRYRTVNQVTETELSQPFGRLRSKTFSSSTEADATQALSRRKSFGLGQPTGTNTAQPVTARLGHTVLQVSETELAQPFTVHQPKRITVNQVSETDVVQPISRRKSRTLGQNTETDLAQSVTRRKSRTLGEPAETDLAQPATHRKAKAIGQASSDPYLDSYGDLYAGDLAQPLTRRKSHTLGQPSDTELAQAFTHRKTKTLGQPTETDTVSPISRPGRLNVNVGQAVEADSAQPMGKVDPIWRAVTQPAETDAAQSITPRISRRYISVGQVSETDAAQPLSTSSRKNINLGQPAETELAQPISHRKTKTLGQPTEADSPQPITGLVDKNVVIGQVVETELAQPMRVLKRVTLNQLSELETGQSVTALKSVLLGQPTEVDETFTLIIPHYVQVHPATETDEAGSWINTSTRRNVSWTVSRGHGHELVANPSAHQATGSSATHRLVVRVVSDRKMNVGASGHRLTVSLEE